MIKKQFMNKTKPVSYNVIPFANKNNHISPSDLDDIMEDLNDMGYLSDKGKEFETAFWKIFIQREKNNKK